MLPIKLIRGERKMKKYGILCITMLLIVSLGLYIAGCASQTPGTVDSEPEENAEAQAGKEVITLSLVSMFPPTAFQCTEILDPLAEEIEKASNGRIKIDLYHGGTLLGAGEELDGVIQGSADMAYMMPGYFPGRFPLAELLGMPGTPLMSSKSASLALEEVHSNVEFDELKDVKVLIPISMGPGAFISKKPFRSLEDMKGLTYRATSEMSPAVVAIEGSSASLTMAECYEALSRGVVDATFTPVEALKTWRLAEAADYLTPQLGLNDPIHYIIMNLEVFNSLPEDLQTILEETAYKFWHETGIEAIDNANKEAFDYGLEEGIEVIHLPDADRATFLERVSTLQEERAKELDAQGLPGTEALKIFREATEKYDNMYPPAYADMYKK